MMQISQGISREAWLFLLFIGAGGGMIFVYDVLRILRGLFVHKIWLIALEDILYWLGCALFLFVMLCRENEGIVRGFIIGSILIGELLYNHFISPFVIRYVVGIVRFFAHMVSIPIKFCGSLLLRPARFVSKYIKRVWHFAKKILKKWYRTIRMVLCKL